MIQIALDRCRAIVKTVADIAPWLSKHSLSILLIGSKNFASSPGQIFLFSQAIGIGNV